MRRITAALAAGVVALGGAGLAGCGDDDNEGPGEEAGEAVDDAGSEAGDELEEAGKEAEKEVDEAGKEAEQEVDDGKKD
jgi:hypothetical protein